MIHKFICYVNVTFWLTNYWLINVIIDMIVCDWMCALLIVWMVDWLMHWLLTDAIISLNDGDIDIPSRLGWCKNRVSSLVDYDVMASFWQSGVNISWMRTIVTKRSEIMTSILIKCRRLSRFRPWLERDDDDRRWYWRGFDDVISW